jgi:hypothetical protein
MRVSFARRNLSESGCQIKPVAARVLPDLSVRERDTGDAVD